MSRRKQRTLKEPDNTTPDLSGVVTADALSVPMGRRKALSVEELKKLRASMRAAITAKPPWTPEQIIKAICSQYGMRADTAKSHLQDVITEITGETEIARKLDQFRAEALLREVMNDPSKSDRDRIAAMGKLDDMFGGISLSPDQKKSESIILTRDALMAIDSLKTIQELEDYEKKLRAEYFDDEH